MIRLQSVTKRFTDDAAAVRDVALQVDEGEVVVLIGPSGCGKTTTLKMINGLVPYTSGQIWIGDEELSDIDPIQLRRRIGYVIQEVGLFPHLSVEENVSFVLRLSGVRPPARRRRAAELLELVGLEPASYARRRPSELSGGERQRVGVARALASDPPIILMDEPFGALDPITRDQLQAELIRLQQQLRKTILFVTHDIREAFRLADRIVLLRAGQVEQCGRPIDLLTRPATPFAADFVQTGHGLQLLDYVSVNDLLQSENVEAAATAGTDADGEHPLRGAGRGAAPERPPAEESYARNGKRDAFGRERLKRDGFVSPGMSLSEGLAMLISSGRDRLPIVERGGDNRDGDNVVGELSLDRLRGAFQMWGTNGGTDGADSVSSA